MRAHRIFAAALCMTILIGSASLAEAQIYAWRDGKGTRVLSDRPLDASARTITPPTSPVTRVAPGTRVGSGHYEPLITNLAAEQGLRPNLVRAVIQVESGFDPYARSPKGALGLMQLMPATAMQLGVANPLDPAQNVRGGVTYLRTLIDRFGSEELALAAYNAGPEAVDRYGKRVPPYTETQDYVRRVRNYVALGDVRTTHTVYRDIEFINGRTVPRYSNVKSSANDGETVRAMTPSELKSNPTPSPSKP